MNEPGPFLSQDLDTRCSFFPSLPSSSHSLTIPPSEATLTDWSQDHHGPEALVEASLDSVVPRNVCFSKHSCLVLKVRM